MGLHADAGMGAILNHLAGTSDFGDAAALRRVAAYLDAATVAGSPEGVVTGDKGDLCTDYANGRLFIKGSGVGTDTGWVLLGGSPAAAVWESYTPTWTATGGTPTVGNGSLVGEYVKDGELCHLRIQLTVGSTTTSTGTVWMFTLPFLSVGAAAGSVVVYDASASAQSATAHVNNNSGLVYLNTGSGLAGSTTPMPWAVGDYFGLSLTYRVAA